MEFVLALMVAIGILIVAKIVGIIIKKTTNKKEPYRPPSYTDVLRAQALRQKQILGAQEKKRKLRQEIYWGTNVPSSSTSQVIIDKDLLYSEKVDQPEEEEEEEEKTSGYNLINKSKMKITRD